MRRLKERKAEWGVAARFVKESSGKSGEGESKGKLEQGG